MVTTADDAVGGNDGVCVYSNDDNRGSGHNTSPHRILKSVLCVHGCCVMLERLWAFTLGCVADYIDDGEVGIMVDNDEVGDWC